MTSDPADAAAQVITVRLFAAARERAERDTVTVEVPRPATVGELRSILGETVPALRPLVNHLLFAIGTEYAVEDASLPDTGEIAAFPPVSGG